jgi:hypothetical protein
VIPQIDAEIAEKGHFWMETNYIQQRSVFHGHAWALSACSSEEQDGSIGHEKSKPDKTGQPTSFAGL